MLNPYLPTAPPDLGPSHTKQHRAECGPKYHHACRQYSQSLWQQGKPAQSILQLNKACLVPDLPAPFPALVWLLSQNIDDQFIGNPVRHFQHLASRMSGPHSELRSWRAWNCFHLAEALLPAEIHPRDHLQIKKEALQIPTASESEKKIPQSDSSSLIAAQALARTLPVTHP